MQFDSNNDLSLPSSYYNIKVNGICNMNLNHRRHNELDTFLLQNNLQPTPRRSTSQRNTQLHLPIHDESFNRSKLQTNPLQKENMPFANNQEHKNRSPLKRHKGQPLISPKKSKENQRETNFRSIKNQSHEQVPNRFINLSKVVNCENHDTKVANFQILIDDENLFYCKKCAAKLASQGFPVKQIMEKSEDKSQKSKQSYPQLPYLPQFIGNPFYEQLLTLLKDISKVESQKDINQKCLDEIPLIFEKEGEKIQEVYEILFSFLQNSKQDSLELLAEKQEKTLQIIEIHKVHLEEDAHDISNMRIDIENNIEGILTEVTPENFRECVDNYQQKLDIVQTKFSELSEEIQSVQTSDDAILKQNIQKVKDTISGIFATKKTQHKKMIETQKNQNNFFVRNVHQICSTRLDSENELKVPLKGPFRNLFGSENEDQSVPAPVKKPLIGKRN